MNYPIFRSLIIRTAQDSDVEHNYCARKFLYDALQYEIYENFPLYGKSTSIYNFYCWRSVSLCGV